MNTKTGDGNEVEELGPFIVSDRGGVQPIWIDVEIEGKTVSMELDTGAAVSIMSSTAWQTLFPRQTLKEADVALRTYTAEKMSVLGQCQVNVKVNGRKKQLVLFIVEGDGPSLLGRDWLTHLQLDWQQIAKVDYTNKLENRLQNYEEIFKEGTETINSYQALIHLKEGANPKYHRARSEFIDCEGKLFTPVKRYAMSRVRVNPDSFDREVIRRAVHAFYEKKEYPTLSCILVQVKEDCAFPGGRFCLWRILKEMGFTYKK